MIPQWCADSEIEHLLPLDNEKYMAKVVITVITANQLKTMLDYNTVIQFNIILSDKQIIDSKELPATK